MEGVYYIIIGLFVDIIGAIFIIRPLLEKIKPPPGGEQEYDDEVEEENDDDVEEEKKKKEPLFLTMKPFSHYTRNYRLAWTGLILLCFGFVLQIIGNYIQSIELAK